MAKIINKPKKVLRCACGIRLYTYAINIIFMYHYYWDSQMMSRKIQAININEMIDPTFTVCADFNQGNASMFGNNAPGKQCVALMIAVY